MYLPIGNSNEHKEVIFFRENAMDKTVETANGPLGLSGAKQGNGRTNPTQNLVDAFLNERRSLHQGR